MNLKHCFPYLLIGIAAIHFGAVQAQSDNSDFTLKTFRLDETQYPPLDADASPLRSPKKSIATFNNSGCYSTDVAVLRVTSNVGGIAFAEPFAHEIAKASAKIGANAYYLDPTQIVNKDTERILEVSGKAMRYSCDDDVLPPFMVALVDYDPKDGINKIKHWKQAVATNKMAATKYGRLALNSKDSAFKLLMTDCFGVSESSDTVPIGVMAYNGPHGDLFRAWLNISKATFTVTSISPMLSGNELDAQINAAEVPAMLYLRQAWALQVGEEDYTAFVKYSKAAGPEVFPPFSEIASAPYDKSKLCSGIHPFVAAKKAAKSKSPSTSKPNVAVKHPQGK